MPPLVWAVAVGVPMCRKNLQKCMQDHAAVYRTQESLAAGVKRVDQVGQRSTLALARGGGLLSAMMMYRHPTSSP
jgi:succinate dehydrogenase/fumarate reductase flavoprotein subunit